MSREARTSPRHPKAWLFRPHPWNRKTAGHHRPRTAFPFRVILLAKNRPRTLGRHLTCRAQRPITPSRSISRTSSLIKVFTATLDLTSALESRLASLYTQRPMNDMSLLKRAIKSITRMVAYIPLTVFTQMRPASGLSAINLRLILIRESIITAMVDSKKERQIPLLFCKTRLFSLDIRKSRVHVFLCRAVLDSVMVNACVELMSLFGNVFPVLGFLQER